MCIHSGPRSTNETCESVLSRRPPAAVKSALLPAWIVPVCASQPTTDCSSQRISTCQHGPEEICLLDCAINQSRTGLALQLLAVFHYRTNFDIVTGCKYTVHRRQTLCSHALTCDEDLPGRLLSLLRHLTDAGVLGGQILVVP